MTGTRKGAAKAVATTKNKHGSDFYKRIGAIGGHRGHTGGFAVSKEWAAECGRKGGTVSRRGPAKKDKNVAKEEE